MKFKNLFLLSIFSLTSLFNGSFAAAAPEFVTIYVHGTTTAMGLRLLGKFCKNLAFGQPGIHHIDELPQESLLKKDAQILQQGDASRFDAAHFYTFGWSGKLSFKAREKDGFHLYEGVKKLLLDYKQKYGIFPKLRILTFSHGGNVALNMVKHLPFLQNEKIYLELVIVACPVQKVTQSLIEHDCIDQSYVISSTRDLLQVVDYYRYEKKRYLPCRFFDTSKQNCHQVKVLINDRGLSHLDLMRSFMIHLPYVLNFVDGQCQQSRCLEQVFGKVDAQPQEPCVISCTICDPQFRFYNLFNLPQVVRGQRKKLSKKWLVKNNFKHSLHPMA